MQTPVFGSHTFALRGSHVVHGPFARPHAESEIGVQVPFRLHELESHTQPRTLSQTACAPHELAPLHWHVPLMHALPVGEQSAHAAPPPPHFDTLVFTTQVAPSQQPFGHDFAVHAH